MAEKCMTSDEYWADIVKAFESFDCNLEVEPSIEKPEKLETLDELSAEFEEVCKSHGCNLQPSIDDPEEHWNDVLEVLFDDLLTKSSSKIDPDSYQVASMENYATPIYKTENETWIKMEVDEQPDCLDATEHSPPTLVQMEPFCETPVQILPQQDSDDKPDEGGNNSKELLPIVKTEILPYDNPKVPEVPEYVKRLRSRTLLCRHLRESGMKLTQRVLSGRYGRNLPREELIKLAREKRNDTQKKTATVFDKH